MPPTFEVTGSIAGRSPLTRRPLLDQTIPLTQPYLDSAHRAGVQVVVNFVHNYRLQAKPISHATLLPVLDCLAGIQKSQLCSGKPWF
jgi:hypothetical protein